MSSSLPNRKRKQIDSSSTIDFSRNTSAASSSLSSVALGGNRLRSDACDAFVLHGYNASDSVSAIASSAGLSSSLAFTSLLSNKPSYSVVNTHSSSCVSNFTLSGYAHSNASRGPYQQCSNSFETDGAAHGFTLFGYSGSASPQSSSTHHLCSSSLVTVSEGFVLSGYEPSSSTQPLSSGGDGFLLSGYIDSANPQKRSRRRNKQKVIALPPARHVSDHSVNGDYRDLGDCTTYCEYCGAAFWYAERLKSTPVNEPPRYNKCCKGGRIRMDYPRTPPAQLRTLYEDRHFLSSIRAYNSMFSMTSFGATIDEEINCTPGPFVFKVCGQVCHWLGSLCPTTERKPSFLQLYFYDTANEISNRLSAFPARHRKPLDSNVIRQLIAILDEHNELVKLFRTARDLCEHNNVPELSIQLYQGSRTHPYAPPSSGTLGAIICDSNPNATDFDIIIHSKSDIPQRVNNLHPSYMSLQYPLLFPYGEQGWSPTLKLLAGPSSTHGSSSADDDRLSMNMYYSYQIHDRPPAYTLLLNAGCLFQQYLVDAYISIERNRLEYFHSHQSDLRSDFLSGIHDAISRGDREGHSIGKRIILPSSFTGGPRYMYKHYQDALAICRVHGNPQYFVTFTCNVKWPEITRHMLRFPHLTAQDKPDIIARVFQMKVDEFMTFLKEEKPFGSVAADLYTIEFQKRGLPHCHTLLWVTSPFKIHSPEQVDEYICAEIPDQETEPLLFKVITESMIHGPCGLANPSSPCMQNKKCTKHYPMKHETSTRFDEKGQVHYRRRPNGPSVCKGRISVDNRYVVPYNKRLCNRFQAHINVEYCGWSMLIKYLFKYISKGSDRIRYSISSNSTTSTPSDAHGNVVIDEIKNFVDGRFICPHEASWRILNFRIHCRNPAVQALAVHLEGMQNVTFRDHNLLEDVIRNPVSSKSTLTEWLRNNNRDPTGLHLRYVDYLSEYRWVANGKFWLRRTSKRDPAIGRLVYVHPTSGELYFLRMLLNHQYGCRSFNDIKTIDGVLMPTYRAACEKLGLIGNDREWESALEDASAWASASELRQLFAHMLVFCEISNPLCLWEKFWNTLADDYSRDITNEISISANCVPPDALQQRILYELERLVRSSSSSSSLADFGLPTPQGEYAQLLDNRLLMEEKFYDRDALAIENQHLCSIMHESQTTIYDTVMKAVTGNEQILLFVYGHGGTGKTFLWKAITSGLRALGKIVLTVAASGIASLLLPAGRTAHSRFKIPIKITEESLCNVKKNTKMAELLIETSLIIWDEAPMSDRRCFESLDRSLKDIFDKPNTPFGGRSILLGGDFRQTLPVKPRSTKSTIISLSLPKSNLWSHFRVFRLTQNMRLHKPDMSYTDRQSVKTFSEWLLSIGDGKIGSAAEGQSTDVKNIEIPNAFIIPYNNNALSQLIDFIYDSHTLQFPDTTNLHDKAIVCPKNHTAEQINQIVLQMTPGTTDSYLSTDSLSLRANDSGDSEMLYPMGCYRLHAYIPIAAPKMYKVALNDIAIRINSRSPFQPIDDDGTIPTTYYNFITYENLIPRISIHKVLSDFIGIVYSIQLGDPHGNAPSVRLNIEDISGNTIQVALWPEIAELVDVERLLHSLFKLVVAFTSLKVTHFMGTMQLESTSATRIEIEPEIELARTTRAMYHSRHPPAANIPAQEQGIIIEDPPCEKNRTTISDLLQKEFEQLRGNLYTCSATFTAFKKGWHWRYPTCPICKITMEEKDGSYSCKTHQRQDPHYRYCIKGDVTDGTGTVTVTIFNNAAEQLLDISCDDMVRSHGGINDKEIPEIAGKIKGLTVIYQLGGAERNTDGNITFRVNRIFKNQAGNKRPMEQSAETAKKGKKAVTTEHKTPAAVQELASGTSSSIAVTKEAERIKPHAMKQLFQIQGETKPSTEMQGNEEHQGKASAVENEA